MITAEPTRTPVHAWRAAGVLFFLIAAGSRFAECKVNRRRVSTCYGPVLRCEHFACAGASSHIP
jgi:hypothetical protein